MPRCKKFASALISKGRAKALLKKWLLLFLDEKVSEEQSVKVFGALEALCRAYPNFAASFESAKVDLKVLVCKLKISGASS